MKTWTCICVGVVIIGVIISVHRKRFMSAARWLKSFGATYLVAVVVWISGAISSLSEAYAILTAGVGSAGGLAWFYQFVLSVLIVISLAHQGLVFHSLHDLDHNTALRSSLRGWLDTRTEWCLRVLCVVMLLCVAGEIPHLLSKIGAIVGGNATMTSTAREALTTSQSYFALYSAVLFFFLLVWDLGAKLWSETKPPPGEARERAYLWSDLGAFCAWVLMAVAQWPLLTERWEVVRVAPVLVAFILAGYSVEIVRRIMKEIVIPSQKYVSDASA